MTPTLSAAILYAAEPEATLKIKSKLENFITAEGGRVIFQKVSSKKLYILEDTNGSGPGNGGG